MSRVTVDKSDDSKLSASNEDYLEAIYQLGGETGSVRSVDIAAKLDVSKVSVNKALTNLKNAGLVEQQPYGDITLTKLGAKYASGVQTRHEVLSSFLIDVLNIDEDKALEEACKMEHAISDETLLSWVDFMKNWHAGH